MNMGVEQDRIAELEAKVAELERERDELRRFKEAAHDELDKANRLEISTGLACAALIADAEDSAPEREWHHRAHWAATREGQYDVLVAKRDGTSNLDWVLRVEAQLAQAREDAALNRARLVCVADAVKQDKALDLIRVEVGYWLSCGSDVIEQAARELDAARGNGR